MNAHRPPAWVQDAVFYQIFPDRFRRRDPGWPASGPATRDVLGGDLVGVRDAIPYLERLGVNALYLTPIFTASSYHRYDTTDYYQVDPRLGGKGALADLVAALHDREMRIVLDGVFNHASDRHPFFEDVVRGGSSSPYWDWFTVRGASVEKRPKPNYACWAGVPGMPEWNLRNPTVREYLLSVVRYWIEALGIDGWRLDTTEYLPPDFVREIYRVSHETRAETYVLGEVMGLGTPWFRHDALDGVMHYKLWERLVAFFAEGRWDAERFVASVLSIWHSYTEDGNAASMTLLGSHDKPRFLTLCDGDRRRLLLAATFLFTFPGAPAIYYGDEIGMQGGEDPDNRRPFPWQPERWDDELLSRTRALALLRRRSDALRRGDLAFGMTEGRALTMERRTPEEMVVVALNADPKDAAFVSLGDEGPYVDAIGGEPLPSRLTLAPLDAVVAYRRVEGS
ncbi:MAG: glycoside hydrolase family 13 protein [Candidatus Bipolaricaulota bacterium]